MSRYKVMTPIEMANEDAMAMAEKISVLHAELVKRRLPDAVIDSVLDKIGAAACSNSDGNCMPVAQPGIQVSNPLPRQVKF